ncbi:MAG: hypothetical protein ACTSRD_03755 [Promethearchaeota archaeon]
MKNNNKKIRTFLLIVTAASIILVFMTPTATSASYSFQVDKMKTNVFINYDGSIQIEYWINFTNNNWGAPIDWIDIGFPTEEYELNSVSATIDGLPISSSRIAKSSEIDIGVEVDLRGGNEINAGDSAQFYIEGRNPGMIYQDYENRSMGSLEFTPTWFDKSFCTQYEELEVNIYFPANETDGNLVKYHYDVYDSADPNVIIGENHYLVYTWIDTNVPMKQHHYGVSFPGDWVDSSLKWSANPRLVRIFTNILFWTCLGGIIVGLGVIIYRKSKKSKKYYPPKKRKRPSKDGACITVCCILFVIGFIIYTGWFTVDIFLMLGYFAIVLTGLGMIGYTIFRLIKRVRKPYYKPRIMVESVGVKKGLSVVEAAIIKNAPLGKVVFLIVFSLIRTGHLKILDVKPLKLEKLGKERSKELNWYQTAFLDAVKKDGHVYESRLRKLLIKLIKKTQSRLKGHNLEATKRYYENMINKAWDTVRKLPKEIEWKEIEKEYEWLILDEQFENRSERYLEDRYYSTYPYWYHHYYYHSYYWRAGHYYRYHPSYTNRGITPRISPPTRINLRAFSDSIVRGIENTSNRIVKNFSTFAEKIVNATRPVIKPSSGSSGGGSRSYSGGGCACACACAGCACACAGGGR